MAFITSSVLGHLAAGGAALASSPEGMTLFVEGGAPGDCADIEITEEHKTWARARIRRLLEPGPGRVEARCPYCAAEGNCCTTAQCGGCNLQHLDYQTQLEEKAHILKETLLRIGGFDESSLPPIKTEASPPWAYRNRMQFHRLNKGLYALAGRRSSNLTAVSSCPIAVRGIDERLRNKTMPPPPSRPRFTVYSKEERFLLEATETSRGSISLGGKELQMDAGVFFQSNAVMQERLVAELGRLVEYLPQKRGMLDIYAGVGVFTALIGSSFAEVGLIEANHAAVSLAQANTRGPGRQYFAMSDEQWVKNCTAKLPPLDFALADPPRNGMSPFMSHWLAKKGPPLLAYVSCMPSTLARDHKILVRGGYCLRSLGFYDFYPQTSHIESLAVLTR